MLLIHNRLIGRIIAITILLLFLIASAMAVREIVVIEQPQPAQKVEGIVLDPSGAPIPDMVVSDRTEEWAAVLRTTKTDPKGHFRFSRQRGKTVYYLRFDHPFFNPLQLKLKLDKNAPKSAITVQAPIGG
jgi:hypothetical protein